MPNVIDFDTRRQGGPTTRRLPIQNGAVFRKGQFVILTNTGIAGPPAAGVNYGVGGFSRANQNMIAGKALHNSVDLNGVAVKYCDFEVAEPGTQFPIALYHATPASAVATLAQLNAAGFELRSSALIGGMSIPQIALDATTNIAGRICDFVVTKDALPENPQWPISVTGGLQFALAWFEFRAAVCAFTGAQV